MVRPQTPPVPTYDVRPVAPRWHRPHTLASPDHRAELVVHFVEIPKGDDGSCRRAIIEVASIPLGDQLPRHAAGAVDLAAADSLQRGSRRSGRLINMLSSGSLVGQRPDRYEPRAIKRRPRGYKLLVHSREVAKTMLHKKSKK